MRISYRNVWIALTLLAMSSLAMAQTQTASGTSTAATAAAKEAQAVKQAEAYPLDYCIVTGERLGSMGAPVIKVYDGREVSFCCNACPKTFEKDKAKWVKKLDAAIIAAQKPTYPLNTCVVSGDTLGSMGQPVDYVYGNQLVRFCCNACVATFKKNPGKYLEIIDAAAAAEATQSPGELEGAGDTRH
jgi:YHS domain-containing protein